MKYIDLTKVHPVPTWDLDSRGNPVKSVFTVAHVKYGSRPFGDGAQGAAPWPAEDY